MAISAVQRIQFANYEDSETGCIAGDAVAFQLCRQAYFLKQQNQILQNQQPDSKSEEDDQLTTETQMPVEEVNAHTGTIEISPTILYALVLAVVVIATIFITQYLTKKL